MEIVPLEALSFFAFKFDLLYFEGKRGSKLSKNYRLASLANLFDQPTFAEVFFGWNEDGLFIDVQAENRHPKVFYPDFRKGDSVELFLDTRDIKNTGYSHRFCHHFIFLPKIYDNEGEKVQGKEITRFRGEEKHDHCDPNDLFIECEELRKGFYYQIFIPKNCLFGFDPLSFAHLGFTYRINRYGAPPQYFSSSSNEYSVEQNPSTWASCSLQR